MERRSSGMVLLNKPTGVTSFEALWNIKHALNEKRIGHTGTLDRFASGLLPVLIGSLTRITPLVSEMDKIYTASILFGEETDTLDPEGRVIASGPVPSIDEILSHIPEFVGTISQVPPQYSAVHVEGKRAYERARSGEVANIKPRNVRISSIDVMAYEPPALSVTVRCSRGTYIRSLARDLGRACGSCAHLTALTRTEVGPFSLARAIRPEEFDPAMDILSPLACFTLLPQVEIAVVKDEWENAVLHGVQPRRDSFIQYTGERPFCALMSSRGRFLGLAERRGENLSYCFVAEREQ